MAIVFKKNADSTPVEKALNFEGIEGKEYDFEAIENSHSRNSNSALVVQCSGEISENEGNLYLNSEKVSLTNIKDATKKYLLDD